MDHSNLFDSTFWDKMFGRVTEIQGYPDATQHLVYRFLGQYLPALLSSRTQDDRNQVWLALWHYLTTPATTKKPFTMSSSSADGLIEEIQSELSRQG